jgi:aerobic carbon-monoxide dehydrogenase medium subunit
MTWEDIGEDQMITAEFDYSSPSTLDQVFRLLSADSDNVKVLAGGMTMVPMLNLGLIAPTRVISLRNVVELNDIHEEEEAIVIGAMTRHRVVAADQRIAAIAPALALAARLIGDVQVRNRGTLGGSLAHADPAANYLPAVVLLNTEFNLASPGRGRSLTAPEFFRDAMTTALDPDELIVSIRIKRRPLTVGYAFRKFTRVKGNFPIVCVAALWDRSLMAGKIVIGGVTATPSVVEITPDLGRSSVEVGNVVRETIVDPLEDLNGDAEYKREMAAVIAGRALTDAISDSERRLQS